MMESKKRLINANSADMEDICDTCAFEDACPSAHFHPTGGNICAYYKSMKKEVDDIG